MDTGKRLTNAIVENEMARISYKAALENSMLTERAVAEILEIKYETLNKWKHGNFDFAETKLNKVQAFNERFKSKIDWSMNGKTP